MRNRILAVTAAILASTGGTALAQQDLRGTGVEERTRPDYDPAGIRAGTFLVRPSVTVAGQYDDNIFADDAGAVDDYVIIVQPRLNITSDWGRHALNFRTGAELARYQDFESEDYDDFHVGADGRLDVGTDYAATGGLQYSRQHEDRGSPNDVNGAEPTEFDLTSASVGFAKGVTRINGRVRAEYQGFDFEDVRGLANTVIDQDNRDRDVWGLGGRVGYEVRPGFNAFVDGALNWVEYDNSPLRDSDGYRVSFGASIDLGGVTTGEVFAGYRAQDYDNPAFEDIDGFTYGASVLWLPTGLTSVRFSLVNEVAETIQASSPGFVRSAIGVEVDHELLRNVILGGEVRYTNDDYERIPRKDDVWQYALGARYLITRNFSVGGEWRHTDRGSNAAGQDYKRDLVTLRVTAAL
ncbi:MAG TPA: outer membrane beta-barrel protein [Azospirillaceae bacterium]|nr:outer membrane beta-barrel protein [Azospirillaceae bacterium]